MRGREVVLVFGEDENDRAAIRVLVQGIRADLAGRVAVEKRRSPITLVKGMRAPARGSRAGRVAAVVRAEHRVRTVRACVFHEDTDAVEPSSAALADEICSAYAACPGAVVAAVAAWEIEAWWYLFPRAVVEAHPTWQLPDRYVGRDTGRIMSPKEKLKRDVRPPGRGPAASTYEERHSESIARAVVEGEHLNDPAGTSASWSAFIIAVQGI